MSQLIQYKGPFQSGSRITVPAQIGTIYIHIGIQEPKPRPSFIPKEKSYDDKMAELTGSYGDVTPRQDISINGQVYHLNQNGILEFDDLGEIEWNIRFLRYFPPETIVDIIIDK